MSNLPDVLQRTSDLGHAVFTNGSKPYNLNIVHVRNPDREANTFNDRAEIWWPDVNGGWEGVIYPITTDPGAYYRREPMRVEGTAILVPGQYRGAYTLGRHRDQYEALVQTGPVQVYRDANRDAVLDWSGREHQGFYGINIHRASAHRTSTEVDRWSAGCQVYANPEHFAAFLELCRASAEHWGSKFSLTLIEG